MTRCHPQGCRPSERLKSLRTTFQEYKFKTASSANSVSFFPWHVMAIVFNLTYKRASYHKMTSYIIIYIYLCEAQTDLLIAIGRILKTRQDIKLMIERTPTQWHLRCTAFEYYLQIILWNPKSGVHSIRTVFFWQNIQYFILHLSFRTPRWRGCLSYFM